MSWGVNSCRLISVPRVQRDTSDLVFMEQLRHVPFEIKRVYFLTNFDTSCSHAHHAHKRLEQVYICVKGTVDVVIQDATNTKTITLDDSSEGLYIGNMVWRHIKPHTSDTVLLVLASQPYDESDYYRNFDQYETDVAKYHQAEFE